MQGEMGEHCSSVLAWLHIIDPVNERNCVYTLHCVINTGKSSILLEGSKIKQ